MRFPAHKAGVFSRFLTICSGRYSLECSPLIFFCSRDWRSWCWTWPGGGIFLVLKLGLHLLLGEPQGTEGGAGPHPDTAGSRGTGEQVLRAGGGGEEPSVSVLGSSLPPEELWREHPPETAEHHFDLVCYHYKHTARSSSNSLLRAQGPCSAEILLGSCPCSAGALRLRGSG